MPPRAVISPDEAAEVRQLRVVFERESALAAEAMRTAGEPLVGDRLRQVLEHDAAAGRALQRIHEIYGD